MKKKSKKIPGTLRATDKVASVGPVLGGNPKKGTLSKKFFGCGIELDLGDKELLEAESNEFAKLKKVNANYGAALITAKNKVYLGQLHWYLRREVINFDDDPSLDSGTVRIRYAGTEGFYVTNIEFTKTNSATLKRVYAALDLVSTRGDEYVVEYSGRPCKTFSGTREEIKDKMATWLIPESPEPTPAYSPGLAYWRESRISKKKLAEEKRELRLVPKTDKDFLGSIGIKWESRWLKHKKLVEGLTYKEFRNASKAVSKVCPSCGNTFKNVHDAKQTFCSLPCEEDSGLTEKLKESFKGFV